MTPIFLQATQTRLTDEIYKKQTDQSNLEEILFEAEVAKEEFEG